MLVFDTETTGFPVTKGFNDYYNPVDYEYYNDSRVIELAYIIVVGNKKVKQYSSLIKPAFQINNSHIHGITNDMASKGVDIKVALAQLEQDMMNYNVKALVAHNVNFDYNIILAECHRLGKFDNLIQYFDDAELICTMELSKVYYGKNLKLGVLYNTLYGEDPEKSHRALEDTITCWMCYKKLK